MIVIHLPDDDVALAKKLFYLTMLGVVAYGGIAFFLVR